MKSPLGARTRLVLTSLLATAAILLAACGGDDDPGADPSPSVSTSASVSGEPTESESTTVAPATGKLIETKAFTVNVPADWDVDVVSKDFVVTAYGPEGIGLIAFKIVSWNGAQPSLDALAKDAVKFGTWPGKDPSIVAPTELGGESAYHLTGSGNGSLVDARGAMHGTDAVSVNFEIYGSPAKLQSIADSVLATWQWK